MAETRSKTMDENLKRVDKELEEIHRAIDGLAGRTDLLEHSLKTLNQNQERIEVSTKGIPNLEDSMKHMEMRQDSMDKTMKDLVERQEKIMSMMAREFAGKGKETCEEERLLSPGSSLVYGTNLRYDRIEAMMYKSIARMDSWIQEYEIVGSIMTPKIEEIKCGIEMNACHLFDELPQSNSMEFQHESYKFGTREVYSKANESVTDKVATDKVAIVVEKVKEVGSSVGIDLKSYRSEDVFFSNTIEEFSDSEVSPRIDEYLDSVDQHDENMKEDLISTELTGLKDYETRMKDESKKALENVENKNQIVECNALPALILKLQSEDVAIHHEAVGVIENLVLSSLNIKREVLLAGALHYVIGLLSSCCLERQRGNDLLLGQFSATSSDYKVHIVPRGCVKPLIEILQFSYPQLREMKAFGLQRLARDMHNQAGIAHRGGIVPPLKLLNSNDGFLQPNAAFTLYGLANTEADNEDNIADIIKAEHQFSCFVWDPGTIVCC